MSNPASHECDDARGIPLVKLHAASNFHEHAVGMYPTCRQGTDKPIDVIDRRIASSLKRDPFYGALKFTSIYMMTG